MCSPQARRERFGGRRVQLPQGCIYDEVASLDRDV